MSTDQPTTGSQVNETSGWFTVLPSLVTPICVGLSLYFGLQYLINENHITNETVLRYINGHPVSRLTVGMFLIGLTSLAMIGMNVFAQFSTQQQIYLEDLPEPSPEKTPGMGNVTPTAQPGDYVKSDVELAIEHGESLLAFPKSIQRHYLWSRLVNSLHYIYRTGSVGGVEDEMKYLAEMDVERQQQRYSLSRILIWATPMLGFLGTVLGISQALGGISVGPDNDFQQMMGGLQGSLYVAFDTTALALSLFDVQLGMVRETWKGSEFLPIAFLAALILSCGLLPWVDRPRRLKELGAMRWMLAGTFLMGLQSLSISYGLATYGDAARMNIVYALRGLWGVVLAWLLAGWLKTNEGSLPTKVMVIRLVGAIVLVSAVVVALV